jgi:hypothetical protein
MSRVTGPNPEDRELAASYVMSSEGTVTRSDG